MSTGTDNGKAATLGSPPAAAAPRSINLDTSRAARREALGDAIEVTNQGVAFRLPVELPADAIEPLAALSEMQGEGEGDEDNPAALRMMRGALEQGLAALFCTCPVLPTDEATGWVRHERASHSADCQWPRFLATRPSIGDELELWSGLFTVYGVSLGEALASLDSAASDGTQSTPTGPATTGATRGTSGAGAKPKKEARTSRR